VEWWEALDNQHSIKRVLQEVCAAGPILGTVARTCRHHGFETLSGSSDLEKLNHLSMRAEGTSLELMCRAGRRKRWCEGRCADACQVGGSALVPGRQVRGGAAR